MTAVRPAAGPLTLVLEPLKKPTTIPPTIPAKSPEAKGAFEARATPRHKGRATRKTTNPEIKSSRIDWTEARELVSFIEEPQKECVKCKI
jgi:hypothetical protein